MEQLERLRALTEADRWIERVIAQREHLPELEELASLEGELRSLLDALKEAQATAEAVRRRYATLQESSQRLGQRASDLEKALAAATGSARDLAAMSREHEQVRTRLAETEDEELDAMLELEPLDETINAIKGRAQPGVARRAELQAHVAQLRATLDEEIAALRASRQELAHGLEPQWRQRYDAALARVGTSGAAMVDAGRCDGCRIALSPLDYDRYKHLEAGVVMDCPECGRLLLP